MFLAEGINKRYFAQRAVGYSTVWMCVVVKYVQYFVLSALYCMFVSAAAQHFAQDKYSIPLGQ